MNDDDGHGKNFDVPLGAPAADLSDQLVEIRIDDRDGRLGRRPMVLVRREGRRPATLERPILLDRRGRGRFIGWMPLGLEGISIAPEAGTAMRRGRSPGLRCRRISHLEMVLIAVSSAPIAVLRVVRLMMAGNTKGAAFRFARLFDSAIAVPNYSDWSALQGAVDELDASSMAEASPSPAVRLLLSIEAPTTATTIPSEVAGQTDPCPIMVDAARPASWPEPEPGDLWMRLPAGTRLAAGATRHLAQPFRDDRSVLVTYCDEDRIDRAGRRYEPTFKSAWNSVLVAAGGMSLTCAVFRRAALPEGADLENTPIESLALAVAGSDRRSVVHIPRVLVHCSERGRSPSRIPCAAPRLADEVRPEVAVVIPTRDRADLLQTCVEGAMGESG